jgi:hypothetical protein
VTQVLVFDSKRRNPLGFLARLVADALAAQPGVSAVRHAGTWDIGLALAERRYDLCLVFGGEELSDDLVRACRVRAGRLALWTTEDPYELDQTLARAAAFDLVFSNDAEAATRYPRGRYLPFGYPDALARRLAATPKRADFVYIGKGWPNRMHLVDEVVAASEGLDRRILLTDPVGAIARRPGVEVGPGLAYTAYLSVLAAARTCLIVGRDYTTNRGANSRPRSVSPPPRFFECLGLGTVPIVLGSPPEPTARLAPAGWVACPGPADLCAAIRAALARPTLAAEATARFSLSASVAELLHALVPADPVHV